jgi:hypothetical protein
LISDPSLPISLDIELSTGAILHHPFRPLHHAVSPLAIILFSSLPRGSHCVGYALNQVNPDAGRCCSNLEASVRFGASTTHGIAALRHYSLTGKEVQTMADLCLGTGTAIGKMLKGPCTGTASQTISLDEAAKLMEEAVDKAKEQATKDCPQGCTCEGQAETSSKCQTVQLDSGAHHFFIVTAAFYGTCDCSKKPVKPAGGGGVISGTGYVEFFKEVDKLPELPKNPTKCTMYKQQIGHGFPVPVCAGDDNCAKGAKCEGAKVTWKGEKFTISPCACK